MAEFKHRKLKIWNEGRKLVKMFYQMTALFPKEERYGLTDQMRRAAVSVPSNIAEGSSRETPADFVHFLVIARGSIAELDTQLTLSEDLNYVSDQTQLHASLESLARQINSLIAHIKSQSV